MERPFKYTMGVTRRRRPPISYTNKERCKPAEANLGCLYCACLLKIQCFAGYGLLGLGFVYRCLPGMGPSKAPLLNPLCTGNSGTLRTKHKENITGSGTQYFKFTNAPDWNHTNYGDGGKWFFSVDGNAGG
jgi:hypothetical protein